MNNKTYKRVVKAWRLRHTQIEWCYKRELLTHSERMAMNKQNNDAYRKEVNMPDRYL